MQQSNPPNSCLSACFENISGGVAAGWAAGFVSPRLQISLEYAPSSRLTIPFPIYFQNTLSAFSDGWLGNSAMQKTGHQPIARPALVRRS
jgi:hypothetical protein